MRISGKNSAGRSLAVLLVPILWLLAASCSDSKNQNSNNANQNANVNVKDSVTSKDNPEELSTLIKLPILPDEKNDERVEWREETVGQKGKKLTAILKYNDENAAKIIAQAEKEKPGSPVEIGVEEWYPEELTAQTQLSGNESLKGIAYAAKDFYNPPYNQGRLIRIQESNYFVLELTSY